MHRPRLAPFGFALALALLSACASGGSQTGDTASPQQASPQGSIILVRNTAPGAVTVNVFLKPDVGVDTPLGSVDGGQSKEFSFDGPPGRYTLRAIGSLGETLSETFQLYRNSQATWDMSVGKNVRVGGRR
jgi:hypothetical protein